MSSVIDTWPALSFLEGLRPGPDEHVELALLASYSADLGSIGATLLALAGKDSDAGSGSPSDFADAVERLRGKVRIVIQRGRLAKMRRTPRIAAVLDQFVREVDFDETIHSWHPKTALVRMRSDGGEIGWRLWLGSRNLTECVNRDIGILLTSGTKGGALIPGVGDLARSLAERADLKAFDPAALASAVTKIAWKTPAGVRVERIRWTEGAGNQTVPIPPEGTDEVAVVSPFIDQNFLARQITRGEKSIKRVLLTTLSEIERIGPPLAAFDELLVLDAPDYPVADPGSDQSAGGAVPDHRLADAEEEEVGRGLHAKLLFMRSGQKRRLWLGSANATMRAWTGRNVEVIAELLVTESIEKGLKALLGSARPVGVPTSARLSDAVALEERALERARVQVAARWAAQLNFDGDRVHLTHQSARYPDGPHPDELDILLEVGSLQGELAMWPVKQVVVDLGPVAPAERTEFVRLRVSRGDKSLAWLQRAPSDPPFGEDRDRAAFVRFLGARGFLIWLAGLLADDGQQSDGDWMSDEPQAGRMPGVNQLFDSSLPTLEDMLAAWARGPDKFREIDKKISQYLPAVLEHAQEEEPQSADMLRRFDDLWRKLRSGLGVVEHKGKHR